MLIHDMKTVKLPFELGNLKLTLIDGKRRMAWGFSCKNFDKETGLCNDYKNRPKHPCQTFICHEAVNIIALCFEPIEDLPW
jgi:Fe-S-cluster containining protein